jgi:dienelactone hydrolase
VSFVTEDGWTIYGTLYQPDGTASGPVPGVVVLSEPGWLIRMIHRSNLAIFVKEKGMAVLTIDMRGTGASYGKKDFEVFSQEETDAMQLDIRGAVRFLSSQQNVDPQRIGIVAAGVTAEYAVREAAVNPAAIQSLVLITGAYSPKSLEFLKSRPELPVLTILSRDDPKPVQAASAQPYFASENPSSPLMLVMDRGAAIFNRPGEPREQVADWLAANLLALGTDTPVSFQSEDGWTLRGNLSLPPGNDKVPGVVFVHGINHDQQTWYHLAREVTRSGKAALLFDWRGVRKSIKDDGTWEYGVDMPAEEGAKIYLDVKAAVEYLASQARVDANRIALVSATATNNHAVRAAIGDARIKTLVGLSFYAPDADVKRYLASSDMPLFLIVNTTDQNADGGDLADGTREVYRLSKSKLTELLLYDDAGRGSDMLKVKPELSRMIVRWLNEKLSNE